MAGRFIHSATLGWSRPFHLVLRTLRGAARNGILASRWLLLLCLVVVRPALVQGQDSGGDIPSFSRDLTELSLDELANLRVTSVSKQPQKFSQAPAAISVLTQDDIKQSGATTIADALRLVPGLEVASSDAHTWAITSRGFNDNFANKLLVLMDGRSVY